MRHFVSLLLVGLTLFLGCSKPSTPIPTRERWAWSREALGPGAAEPFEIDVSLYPCQCQGDIGPVPDRSPVAYPHTGLPLIPCTTEEDCQAEKGCRHATCRTDCGFCVFLGYPPCSLDTCTEPGHHTTCATPAVPSQPLRARRIQSPSGCARSSTSRAARCHAVG